MQKHPFLNESRTICCVLAILLLAVVMRFACLESAPPLLYFDEAMYGIDAAHALEQHDFRIYYASDNGREGMFANLVALSFSLFSDSIFALRAVSAFCGSLTVLLVFFLTLELFHSHARRMQMALIAMFLVAISYWDLNFSRIAFHGSLIPPFETALVWVLLMAARLKKKRLFLLAGILFGLGFYTYRAFEGIVPFVMLLTFRRIHRRKMSVGDAITFALPAVLLVLPLAIFAFDHPHLFFNRTSEVSLLHPQLQGPYADALWARMLFIVCQLLINMAAMAQMPFLLGDPNWRHNYGHLPELSLLAISGIAYLAYRWRKVAQPEAGERNAYALLFAWTAFASLPAIFASEGIPHSLRGIGMLVPLHLLAAAGLSAGGSAAAASWPQRRALLKGIFALLLLGNLASTSFTYFFLWRNAPQTKEALATDCHFLNRHDALRYGFMAPYRGCLDEMQEK